LKKNEVTAAKEMGGGENKVSAGKKGNKNKDPRKSGRRMEPPSLFNGIYSSPSRKREKKLQKVRTWEKGWTFLDKKKVKKAL